MNREDFLFLNQDIIYFDSASTSLKPKILSEAISEYYNCYSTNIYRGEYDMSLHVNDLYEKTRIIVSEFINANKDEIIFTSGATDAINKIVLGYFEEYLTDGDEVLLTVSEHSSNILPWFELSKRKNIVINYIPLDENHKVTLDNVKSSITKKTKVISIAHITNVIGDIRPIKEITEIARENNILVVCDGAQSVPHISTDVKNLDVEFLVFSSHKMCGPTGLGILYGKKELLDKMKPIIVGGGMNSTMEKNGDITHSEIPRRFEAGTPNISAIVSFSKIIEYLNNVGMNNITKYVLELTEYAHNKFEKIDGITIYNKHSEAGIITFNAHNIFAQDLAIYLNKHNICVRAGNHCAKLLKEEIGVKNTVRMSLYFYNTKEEIDQLCELLKNKNIIDEII